jgi:hypothetical protein
MASNPFFELYVGDRLSSEEYVTIFSPFLVESAEPLFVPGNIVVTGVQGSGKSMLLSLLRPDIRLSYAKGNMEFPVAKRMRNFIGAGINLAHSNAIDFGYRRFEGEESEVALLFGDFVNYSIALDLLSSVQKLSECAVSSDEIGIVFDKPRREALAGIIRKHDVWEGYLAKCQDLRDIEGRMRLRINSYRSFLHMNDQEFKQEIRETKTAIGDPISALVQSLVQSEIIKPQTNVFVHVDQYEELANITYGPNSAIDYRAVINRALAKRDRLVSYRIGTRGHAWHGHAKIFGVQAKLEEERDYKFIDLDEKLRRNENVRGWIFPPFAADVFARRLRYAELTESQDGAALLKHVFGDGLTQEQKAMRYAGKSPARAVRLDDNWPPSIKTDLLKLAESNPLSARLGEAWILQKGVVPNVLEEPWNEKGRQWWKKERIDLALLQIAGRCAQRPFWCGRTEVIDLSGGNILIFMSICQIIWDVWLQIGNGNPERKIRLQEIEPGVQAVGVLRASEYWLKKISQETGRSGERLRFVRGIADKFGMALLSSRKLSNPGHNGFSVADEDLDRSPDVKDFLEELSDYGNLLVLKHTTKEKDRRSRRKWYLNPILCPNFKLPYKRLKEPRYVTAAEVADWMREFGIKPQGDPEQLSFFAVNRQ